jgi:flagellar biosynthetic protein FliR
MSALLITYQGPLLVYALILTRLVGVVAGAPLTVRALPPHLRLLSAAGLALLITPLHIPADADLAVPTDGILLAIMLARELVLGLAQGLVLLLLVTGIQLAGQLLGQISGMQLGDVNHSDLGTPVPAVSRLLELVTLAVFLAMGGHRQVMACVLDSFRWMPPGAAVIGADLISAVTEVARYSFELGIRASAPVVVSLLVSVLTLGLISRTLPQLNVLAVGFSVNVLVLLASLLVSLGTVVLVFDQYVGLSLEHLQQALTQSVPVP